MSSLLEVLPSPVSRPLKTINATRVSFSYSVKSIVAKKHIGKPVSHQFAKELLAGFAGAEVDKLAETKGEDFFDKERSKHEAKKRAEAMYDDHYGGQDQYDPSQQAPPQALQDQFGGDRWN
jgi:hypothetical protein